MQQAKRSDVDARVPLIGVPDGDSSRIPNRILGQMNASPRRWKGGGFSDRRMNRKGYTVCGSGIVKIFFMNSTDSWLAEQNEK